MVKVSVTSPPEATGAGKSVREEPQVVLSRGLAAPRRKPLHTAPTGFQSFSLNLSDYTVMKATAVIT